MNRNGSEASVNRFSWVSRRAGALLAAIATSVAVAPALAADVNALTLNITQNPSPAVYGTAAIYTVTLKNTSNKTVNNAGITVTAPAGTTSFDAPSPSCALSTLLPCAAPAHVGTTFTAAGYQLPGGASLTIAVGYNMPPAGSPPEGFLLTVTGTSSNNATGPKPSAYTTFTTNFAMAPAEPPPSYPNIQLTIGQDNTVLWSTAACANLPSDDRDCGATYYGQYTVVVQNADSANAIPSTRPFEVEVSSPTGAIFQDSFGCEAPCSPGLSSNKFTITGLSAGGSTSFKVLFRSPLKPSPLDVKAVATVGPLFTPPMSALSPSPSASSPTTFAADAAIENYSSLVPSTGGSAKARNALDVPNDVGPYSTRVDVPAYPKGAVPVNIAIDVKQGTTSCSSWSPKCLETDLDVQLSGAAVTFGAEYAPLDGSQLVITMVRDASTLNKKPSSAFNATVWYTDPAGNRTAVKNCGSVDLRLAERCVAQRLDMTATSSDGTRTGYIKFIIWARHNGKIGW